MDTYSNIIITIELLAKYTIKRYFVELLKNRISPIKIIYII